MEDKFVCDRRQSGAKCGDVDVEQTDHIQQTLTLHQVFTLLPSYKGEQ
jgi:hypothetical protein